jgi:hypothetical protein
MHCASPPPPLPPLALALPSLSLARSPLTQARYSLALERSPLALALPSLTPALPSLTPPLPPLALARSPLTLALPPLTLALGDGNPLASPTKTYTPAPVFHGIPPDIKTRRVRSCASCQPAPIFHGIPSVIKTPRSRSCGSCSRGGQAGNQGRSSGRTECRSPERPNACTRRHCPNCRRVRRG